MTPCDISKMVTRTLRVNVAENTQTNKKQSEAKSKYIDFIKELAIKNQLSAKAK